MQDHPLPQDITGYRFHIIGNMTLKQFAEVGAGAFAGFLIYTTNLHMYIKWPLIGGVVALGVMAAFVPFEERPFDHWISTFIKAMYRPTKFYWKRKPKIPDVFLYEPTVSGPVVEEVDLSPARRQRIKDFMVSLQSADAVDEYEAYESSRVSHVLDVFSTVTAESVSITQTISRPELTVRVRELKPLEKEKKQQSILPRDTDQQLVTEKTIDASRIAQQIVIPEGKTIKVNRVSTQADTEQTKIAQPQIDSQTFVETTAATTVVDPQQAAAPATHNQELPFPSLPTEPNKPVGMVVDTNNQLLTNAIVEIISETGTVVRAVKTNSLGQFFVTTPLKEGSYIVRVEKDNFQFPDQQLTAIGEIMQPIEIRGTRIETSTQPPTPPVVNSSLQ